MMESRDKRRERALRPRVASGRPVLAAVAGAVVLGCALLGSRGMGGAASAAGGLHWAATFWEQVRGMGVAPAGVAFGTAGADAADLDRPVTRGEAAAWLVRALGYAEEVPAAAAAPASFPDAAAEARRGELQLAAELGLMRGDGTGAVQAAQPLLRAQLAVVLERLLRRYPEWAAGGPATPAATGTPGGGAGAAPPDGAAPRDGAAVPDWARDAVAAVLRSGWMSGDPDGLFRPLDPVRTGELAAVVSRVLQYRGDGFALSGTLAAGEAAGVVRIDGRPYPLSPDLLAAAPPAAWSGRRVGAVLDAAGRVAYLEVLP